MAVQMESWMVLMMADRLVLLMVVQWDSSMVAKMAALLEL